MPRQRRDGDGPDEIAEHTNGRIRLSPSTQLTRLLADARATQLLPRRP